MIYRGTILLQVKWEVGNARARIINIWRTYVVSRYNGFGAYFIYLNGSIRETGTVFRLREWGDEAP